MRKLAIEIVLDLLSSEINTYGHTYMHNTLTNESTMMNYTRIKRSAI